MALSGAQQTCKTCDKKVYFIEKLTADGAVYHLACFRCNHCKRTLKLSDDYIFHEGLPYCKVHYESLFKGTGSLHGNKSVEAGNPAQNVVEKLELKRAPSKAASFKFSGTQEKCATCGKTVYPIEKVSVEGMSFHKTCFKCLQGGCSISPSNYAAMEGRLYCKHHFQQLFKQKGNYSQLLVKLPSVKLPLPEGTGI